MNICPNVSEKRAFESLELIFFENFEIFYPSSIPFDFWRDWGRIKNQFLEKHENYMIHTSSMLLKTRSVWGRITMKCLNFKTLGSQLSNARFLESFGRKFVNLHKFENFNFFKFSNFHEKSSFLENIEKILENVNLFFRGPLCFCLFFFSTLIWS